MRTFRSITSFNSFHCLSSLFLTSILVLKLFDQNISIFNLILLMPQTISIFIFVFVFVLISSFIYYYLFLFVCFSIRSSFRI